MRISYLSNSNMPSLAANSVHVAAMCDALVKAGNDVILEALPGNVANNKLSVHKYYAINQNIKININQESEFWLAGLLLKLKSKLNFIKVGPIPNILYGKYAICQKLKLLKPDLIIARNQNWLYGCLRLEIPIIFESHHPARNFIDKYIQTRIFKSRNFKKLIVISEKLKQIYLQDFKSLSDTQILVLHDAARISSFSLKYTATKAVGYVGHLYKGRGIELILRIAAKMPTIKFHIVGGSEQDVANLQKNNTISDNIIFHGHINHANLIKYYDKFDIALAPYQNQVAIAGNVGNSVEFMSPLKIFEYMCYGKAVISSDLPVLREILKHAENSILVPADIDASWVQAIEKLIQEPEYAQKIAKSGQELVKQNHTWEIRARKIVEAMM